MRLMKKLLLASGIALTSCASVTAKYVPPTEITLAEGHKRVISKTFDEVWDRLVQHAAGTYFGIDNFEKESGLLTLSFGAENPSEFVDGGLWQMQAVDQQNRKTEFDGTYVDFLRLHHGGALTGRMNIVVQGVDATTTAVTINTRYVFTSRSIDPRTGSLSVNTWSFDSGGESTIAVSNAVPGTPATRTMRPTQKAERAILEALDGIN